MRPFLPSYAQSDQDKQLREYLARGGRPAPPPAAPQPAVAPPVQQATDDEVAPIARPQAPPEPAEPKTSTLEDIAGGVGRFFVGALSGDGDIFVKQRERSKADPASAASVAARKRLGPMLTALGLTTEEVNSLSAADLESMAKGGNLVTALATGRTKAKAAQANAAAAQQAKLDAEQRAAKQAIIDDERRGNTAGEKMNRATAMAGAAGDRQAQAFAHSDEAQARAFGQAAALQGRREDAALTREERQAAREQARAARAARLELEKEYANAEAELDALEDKLEARAADEALPGSGNIVSEGVTTIKGKVFGGTGRSSDDSILETDLDRAGNSAYKITNGLANTESEQERAKRIFRGNGTAASSLQALREQKAKMQKAQRARLQVIQAGGTVEEANKAGVAAAGGNPVSAGVAADEADLGIEVE